MVYVRFEHGQENRMSEPYGPFEYIQMTYDWLRASPDGEKSLAGMRDGMWQTEDEQFWTDFVIYSDT